MPVGQSSGARGRPPAHSSGAAQMSLNLGGPPEQLTLGRNPNTGRFAGGMGGKGRRGRFSAPTSKRAHSSGAQMSMSTASQPSLPFPASPPEPPRWATATPPQPPRWATATPPQPPAQATARSSGAATARGGRLNSALKYARGNKGKVALGAGAALFAGNRMSSGRGATPENQNLYR